MIWSCFLVLAELVNFQLTGKCIYSQKFGQLDDNKPLIKKFISLIPTLEDYNSGAQIVGKIKFIYSNYNDLFFVLCADKSDEIIPIVRALEIMKVSFAQKYMDLIKEGNYDPSAFINFKNEVDKALSALLKSEETTSAQLKSANSDQAVTNSTVNAIKKEMVKIAFVGAKYAGKRTLLSLLYAGPSSDSRKLGESEMIMKKGSISDKYNALLITIPNKMIEAGKTQFLSNTDIVILVNSSIFRDVIVSRKIYEIIKTNIPNAKYGVIANKQDVSGALEVDAIKKVYELPTIGMVAIDSSNYEKLKFFVEELIEGS